MTKQHSELMKWLQFQLKTDHFEFAPLQGDASFRCYYRIRINNESLIAVDTPPATENNPAFVLVARKLAELGLHAPQVLAYDLERGFLLLSDLGNDVFSKVVQPHNADTLYKSALIELSKIQNCNLDLPSFDDAFMGNELQWFTEWVIETHLGKTLTPVTRKMLEHTYTLLLQSATEQPQCFIHRDYHSRNLMLLPDQKIGILDFQDAMNGPITYDLVSLIRDCYIDWPAEQVLSWAKFYYENFLKSQISSFAQFIRWFDLMGIQRHLKASFIFARKHHRDNVSSYLKDIPRAINYILTIAPNYPELIDFVDWINENVAPQFKLSPRQT